MDVTEQIIKALIEKTGKSKEEVEKEIEETKDIPTNQRIIDCYMNDGL